MMQVKQTDDLSWDIQIHIKSYKETN